MQNKKKVEISVLLWNIRSIHNAASIFRTADAAGVKKVYLCGITPTPLDRFGKILPQFAKVSLGAEKSVDYEAVRSPKDVSALIENLKKDGYKILAIEQSKESVPYNKLHKSFPPAGGKDSKFCLVLGNEVRGLPASILKKSDKILEIPMMGKKESLNVSVAFGVVIYGITL